MSDRKFAVLVNADTDEPSQLANGLQYAVDLDDSGFHVEVYFDGAATDWIPVFRENPEHAIKSYYDEVYERDLVAGVCGYCATAHDVDEAAREEGLELSGGEDDHGPDVGALAADGYEFITVG
ncbi:MAG: hypothetical protein ABEH81_07045 [Halopenitus sp.]